MVGTDPQYVEPRADRPGTVISGPRTAWGGRTYLNSTATRTPGRRPGMERAQMRSHVSRMRARLMLLVTALATLFAWLAASAPALVAHQSPGPAPTRLWYRIVFYGASEILSSQPSNGGYDCTRAGQPHLFDGTTVPIVYGRAGGQSSNHPASASASISSCAGRAGARSRGARRARSAIRGRPSRRSDHGSRALDHRANDDRRV
jgi:hypothetical protein